MCDETLNALTHGITAQSLILPGETYDDWEEHLHVICQSCHPDNELERALATRIAEILWRLRRVVRAETDMIAEAQARNDDWFAGRLRIIDNQGLDPSIAPRQPFEQRIPEPKSADHIIRYEAHLNRQLVQTMHELEALQKRRQGQDAPLARVDFLALARNLKLNQ